MIYSQLRRHNDILNLETSWEPGNPLNESVSVCRSLSVVHKQLAWSTLNWFWVLLPLTVALLSTVSLQPLAKWWRLMPKDAAKMPESAWKLVFYTMSWSYSTYLLFFTSYSFFHDPPSVFYSKKHNCVDMFLLLIFMYGLLFVMFLFLIC